MERTSRAGARASGNRDRKRESQRESNNDSGATFRSSDAKIIDFLAQLRGLDVLQAGSDLEELLYESRFELLPMQQQAAGSRLHGGGRGAKLPPYSVIPSHDELHNALTGGNLSQCVAHVLYPESVAWPFGTDGHADSSERKCKRQSTARWDKESAEQKAGGRNSQPVRPASSLQHGSLATVPQAEEEKSPEHRDDKSPSSHRQSALQKAAATAKPGPTSEQASEEKSAEGSRCCDVLVCGQKINTTVRGRPVLEASEDTNEVADDARYKAAKDRRQQLERAVKLEEYRERDLIAMIATLEAMKEAEVTAHEAILKRERARLRRKEELKEQLKRDNDRKIEEEQLAQDKVAGEEKNDAVLKERAQRYHDKQKGVLEEWYVNRPDDACSEEVRQRKRDEMERKRLDGYKDTEKARTLRQREVQAQMRRIHDAAECRPPMPPRPHDLPAPLLSPEVSRSCSPSSKAFRLHPERALTIDATTVLLSYGLSPRRNQVLIEGKQRKIAADAILGAEASQSAVAPSQRSA